MISLLSNLVEFNLKQQNSLQSSTCQNQTNLQPPRNFSYSQHQSSSQQDPALTNQLQQQPCSSLSSFPEASQLHQNTEKLQQSSFQQGITPQLQTSLQSFGQNSLLHGSTPVTDQQNQQMPYSSFQQHSSCSDTTQSLLFLSDDLLTELESGTEELDLFTAQSSYLHHNIRSK